MAIVYPVIFGKALCQILVFNIAATFRRCFERADPRTTTRRNFQLRADRTIGLSTLEYLATSPRCEVGKQQVGSVAHQNIF